jgi:hypothetical protein
MNFPTITDTTTTDELVSFARWNDRNGNWPVRSPANPSTLPETPAQIWYDTESDTWHTDAEIRAQMVEILTEWKADSDAADEFENAPDADTLDGLHVAADLPDAPATTEAQLCALWETMCAQMGREPMSADEFLCEHRETLTDDQRKAVSAFILLWDSLV